MEIKKYIILSIIWLVDAVDKLLQFCGIKLLVLTQERILGAMTLEQLQETTQPDVAEPFQMFIKVQWAGNINCLFCILRRKLSMRTKDKTHHSLSPYGI